MNRPLFRTLLSAGIIAGACSTGYAQTWDGSVSQDWTDGANWGGAVPLLGGWTVNTPTGNTPIIATAVTLGAGAGADAWVGNGGNTGVLDINAGGSLDSSDKWLFVGGDNGSSGTGTVNVNPGGSYTSNTDIRLGRSGGTGTLNVDGGTVAVGGLDEGGGTSIINVSNSGSVTSSGGNIRLNVGTSSIDSGTLGATGQLFVNNGATLNQTGGAVSSSSWFVVGINGGGGTFNLSNGTVNVAQSDGATTIGTGGTTGVVNQTGGTFTSGGGTFFLGEAGGGHGTYNLDGGTLVLSAGVIEVGDGTGTLNFGGGTLDLTATGGTLTKAGAGALTITGSGSVATGVSVSAGTLFVNGSLGAPTVTIGSGAAIGGSGTVTGNITVATGGTIAAGNSIGTMDVDGDLAINGILEVEYEQGASQTIDLINVTGNLDITNTTLNLTNLDGLLDPGTYVLATYATLTGSEFAGITGDLTPGSTIDYAFGGNSVALVQVPEPSIALLGGLGVLGLLRRRRLS